MQYEPAFIHPVAQDVFMASVMIADRSPAPRQFDLYVTYDRAGNPDVIARYGSHPSEFFSGLQHSYGRSPSLTQSRVFAQNAGLIGYDMYQALEKLSPMFGKQNSPYSKEERECLCELVDHASTSLEFRVYRAYTEGKGALTERLFNQLLIDAQRRCPECSYATHVELIINNVCRIVTLVQGVTDAIPDSSKDVVYSLMGLRQAAMEAV